MTVCVWGGGGMCFTWLCGVFVSVTAFLSVYLCGCIIDTSYDATTYNNTFEMLNALTFNYCSKREFTACMVLRWGLYTSQSATQKNDGWRYSLSAIEARTQVLYL